VRQRGGEGPQFEISFRGYERASVDEYVTRLHGWLVDSKERADNAAQATAGSIGEQVSGILQAALEAGENAIKGSEVQAEKVREKAEARCAEIIRAAEQRAEKVRAKSAAVLREAEATKAAAIAEAQAEADRKLDDARRQLEELKKGIAQLTAHKEKALTELGRLRQYLDAAPETTATAAAATGADTGADEAPAAAADGDTDASDSRASSGPRPAPTATAQPTPTVSQRSGPSPSPGPGAMVAAPDDPATIKGRDGAPGPSAKSRNGDRPLPRPSA